MMPKKNRLTILLLSFCSIVFAQKTQVYLDKEVLYKTGIELFDKKQYPYCKCKKRAGEWQWHPLLEKRQYADHWQYG